MATTKFSRRKAAANGLSRRGVNVASAGKSHGDLSRPPSGQSCTCSDGTARETVTAAAPPLSLCTSLENDGYTRRRSTCTRAAAVGGASSGAVLPAGPETFSEWPSLRNATHDPINRQGSRGLGSDRHWLRSHPPDTSTARLRTCARADVALPRFPSHLLLLREVATKSLEDYASRAPRRPGSSSWVNSRAVACLLVG